jgi:NADH dehydrogenase [ubiquinone] 1 alpha subcomplex assembly factor 6
MLQMRMSVDRPPDPAAGRYCIMQVRTFDRDRYVCSLSARGEGLRSLLTLFAFNLEIARTRELVREALLGEVRLQWWREGLAEAFAGRPREHPVLGEIAAISRRLSEARLQALVDARARDLDDTGFANRLELEAYLTATAGDLTQAAVQSIAPRDDAALRASMDVGLAWGLVGTIRAVPFHASQRRILLPQDVLESAGIGTESIFSGRPPDSLRRVLEGLADRAADLLRRARLVRRDVSREAVPGLLPATLADAYLGRLSRVGFRVFEASTDLTPLVRPLRVIWQAARNRY